MMDLTPGEHQHNEIVRLAAVWLADLKDRPAPIVPELKTRFGMTSLEAIEAIRMAERMRVLRSAHA